MRFLLFQLKTFFTNRIALTAVLANLVLAIWGLSEKGWNYSNFHFYNEPLPVKILAIINLPVIFLVEIVWRSLFPLPVSQFDSVIIDTFEMFLIVIFSIFQWLLIGYFLNLILRSNQEKIK